MHVPAVFVKKKRSRRRGDMMILFPPLGRTLPPPSPSSTTPPICIFIYIYFYVLLAQLGRRCEKTPRHISVLSFSYAYCSLSSLSRAPKRALFYYVCTSGLCMYICVYPLYIYTAEQHGHTNQLLSSPFLKKC